MPIALDAPLLDRKLKKVPELSSTPSSTFSTPAHSPSVVSSSTELSSPRSINDHDTSSDIAVVGMACRVAGGNDSPEKLWEFLMNKQHGSTEIPEMRWEPYHRRDARNTKALNNTTSRGYFVDKIDDFDSGFFGISPKEAEMMDPQQRLSLEVCWEALESSGIPPQSLAGSNTAVYMGVNSDDYSKLLLEDLPDVEAWMGIGTAYCGIPNRISYHLDLMGPSTAVDAACASSLVAIHHGRQSLLVGETNVAIVGGVNALYGPGLTRVLDKAGAVSSEGICRSFDDESRGYGRGEGAGIVILKRMDDALKNDDRILAVLKGSAVAQDGKTNGIMAPNGKAQELVAKIALDAGGVDPSTVGYVEAHATSTPVGDPVEATAISNVYGKNRKPDDPVLLGSIKPNIGHLEAGAGVMGFMKAVMAVDKGTVPPQANLNKLNSKVDWDASGLKVVQKATEWGDSQTLRRAGIASYGYGGSVSHAVIEEFQDNLGIHPDPRSLNTETGGMSVLLLSAPQEKRLIPQANEYQPWFLGDAKKYSLPSIANTLATRRNHHDYRCAFVVDSHDDAASALKAFSEGTTGTWGVSSRVLNSNASTDCVWVFSGHGAQWKEMGQEMLSNAVFVSAVAAVDPIVKSEMGFSAMQALEFGDIGSSDKVQVLTYVMQIALAAVMKSKGVTPQAIIGHSVGEIAASVVAGALTIDEGAMVVCKRAVLYRKVMGLGSMVMVSCPFPEIEKEIGTRHDIAAAIDSSPSSCVVSGAADTVAEFAEAWKARDIKVIQVKSDVAFHSPVLNQLVEPLFDSLKESLAPRQPSIKLYSTSLADPRGHDIRGIEYWTNNMVSPVHLTQAVEAAAEDGFRVFLEVSSHPIVSHSIDETLTNKEIDDHAIIPTMNRGKPGEKSILYSTAQLHCKGVPVSWKAQMPGGWEYNVPTASWKHRSYVRKIETGPLNTENTHDGDNHTLLGQRIPVFGESMTVYTTKLDQNTKPFPGAHPLHGTEIVPAAVLINTFFHSSGLRTVSDVVLLVPVAISAPRDIQVTAQLGQVKLTSRLMQGEDQDSGDASWVTHTTARFSNEEVSVSLDDDMDKLVDVAAVKARIGTQLKDTFSIDYLSHVGVSAMGFPWAVTEHFGNEKEMIARVDVSPDTAADAPLPWSPQSWAPIFDGATSVGSTLFKEPRLRMPAQISTVTVYNDAVPPKIGYIHVREATETELAVHVDVFDESGKALASIRNMRFSEIEGTLGASGSVESLVHQLSWPPISLAEEPLSLGQTILVSKATDVMERHKGALGSQTHTISTFSSAQEIPEDAMQATNDGKTAAIIYIPTRVESFDEVAEATGRFCAELLDTVKYAVNLSQPVKLFAITDGVCNGITPTALAQAPLHGLGRIIASEQPDIWGALIDNEDGDSALLVQAIRYAQGTDVVKISDGVARTARLRRLPRHKMLPPGRDMNLLPRPEGTYLISGGLGALGVEVANFLVEKGARRLVLLSRRALPPRDQWKEASDSSSSETYKAIEHLEGLGATVHVISIDIASEGAKKELQAALNHLALPPVLGVVHAAGVLEDQLVLESTTDSFSRVLAPKVSGGLALHQLFPVKSLDFFVLFSSCGQLFGFPGQGSYASANAFLDTLACHRRNQGDNSVAFQWTSWRGMGMAASTDFISAELESRGITDVTRDEAFRAWSHLAKYDMDHAVVLRSRAFQHDELLPVPILADIAVRHPAAGGEAAAADSRPPSAAVPKSGPELQEYLNKTLRKCVAETLQLASADDVDPKAALSDLGMDSVMTVGLRRQLQKTLAVKVPPTLTWSAPTVSHLQKWFTEKIEKR